LPADSKKARAIAGTYTGSGAGAAAGLGGSFSDPVKSSSAATGE
jgi:hypothetical protein